MDFQPPDTLGDIYSLGPTLYFAASGRSVFADKKDASQKLTAQLAETPMALRVRNPRVSTSFSAIIEKMLQKDPASRHDTMREVHSALVRHKQSMENKIAKQPAAATEARAALKSQLPNPKP